jgi:hypothetical protein
MRNSGIEIKIDESLIPENIKNELDIEFSSKENAWMLWIHDDGFKPFDKVHFQYMNAALNALNRKTGTDHLDIFLETNDELTDKDKEVNGTKFKNIRFSELGNIDISKVKLKREL